MTVETNHREFTRVKVALHAELRVGGNVVIQGQLDNVSLNGLLLCSDTLLPEHTPCMVFVHLDGGQGGPTIEAQGVVTRTETNKLAVQFNEIVGNESVQHLRNLVLYNSGTQANQVEAEFESHIGLHAKS